VGKPPAVQDLQQQRPYFSQNLIQRHGEQEGPAVYLNQRCNSVITGEWCIIFLNILKTPHCFSDILYNVIAMTWYACPENVQNKGRKICCLGGINVYVEILIVIWSEKSSLR
jgi:hypothetical protein